MSLDGKERKGWGGEVKGGQARYMKKSSSVRGGGGVSGLDTTRSYTGLVKLMPDADAAWLCSAATVSTAANPFSSGNKKERYT